MANNDHGQALIKAFFDALRLHELDRCARILDQLRELGERRSDNAAWAEYLRGILINERDHDWAAAERVFTALLETDLLLPLRGRVLIALGRTYHYLGRWPAAIDAYERSLPVFSELGQVVDQVKAWKEIAISYRRGFNHGDFGPEALEQAIAYAYKALEMLAPLQDDPETDVRWLIGSIWNTLGLTYRSLGRLDAALDAYRRDLQLCHELDDRFGMGLTYGNLGEIYQAQGPAQWPAAQDAYQHALAIIREFDDHYEETEALANLAYLHQQMGDADQALAYYDQAIALIEALRAGLSSEAARAGFATTTADVYANAVLLSLETVQHEQAFALVERARARAFLDGLAARSTDLARAAETSTLTLPDVQATLPPGAVLLEYFTTGLVEAPGDGRTASPAQRHRFPPARTVLFVVTQDVLRVHTLELSPNDLRPAQLDSVAERHFLQAEIRRALYDRLLAPVALEIAEAQRLYVVPHGPLHYIPFQALLAPDGEPVLRPGGPVLIHGPSATVLFGKVLRAAEPAPRSCLALGYNSRRPALQRAEEEAVRIAALTSGEAITGFGPKRDQLIARASLYRMVHLSCHGTFDPLAPWTSALQLAPAETLTPLDVLGELTLHGSLITLSACESGLSRVRRGDELIGLQRAFLHAGASALVSTLWRVDEQATLWLMERFYQALMEGQDAAEALKSAQLALQARPEFAAPVHWAAFTLTGVPSPLPA